MKLSVFLRTGRGLFLINEYHPFRRIWKDSNGSLDLGHSYLDNGPHEYECRRGHPTPEAPDDMVQYEYHWTVSEYLNAVIERGIDLIRFEEIGDEAEECEGAPLGGLPQKLLIAGRKS